MDSEVLLTLFLKRIEDRLAETPKESPIPLPGLRGFRGVPGKDGADFVLSEHEEVIKGWVKDFSLKFTDLTQDQISDLRGKDGIDGKDGKDFSLTENEEYFRNLAKEFSVKFEDFTEEQISKLRGARGRDGVDGESFKFEEHREAITEQCRNLIQECSDSLKLKFSDLSPENLEALKGPRGEPGVAGESFDFEKHREYFETLMPKFSDFTEEEVSKLKLKFSDLSDEEKESLSLKFETLSFEDLQKIRGARGARGQRGIPGIQGIPGESIVGPRGPRGAVGPAGMMGLSVKGKDGRDGSDGRDGQDAPYVVDIRVDQFRSDQADFIFEFSDGHEIRTNSVKLPRPNIYVGGGGGAYAVGSITMKMESRQIMFAQDTTGPIDGLVSKSSKKTFQTIGRTGEGAGTATVVMSGSNNNSNWVAFQEHALVLGTDDVSFAEQADNSFKYVRADVTVLTGTGATIDVWLGEEEWTA